MKNYPKIGIRPTIDGRQGGVRESLEEKTMNLAKAVAELISSHVKYSDGTPVQCVIADGISSCYGLVEEIGIDKITVVVGYVTEISCFHAVR